MNYEMLLDLIQSRRSIRHFTDRPVDREDLLRLFEAARWAPSNHNRQAWKFLVWANPETIRALAQRVAEHLKERLKKLPASALAYAEELVSEATVFAQAPVLIVALHKPPISASAILLQDLPHPTLVSGEPLSVAMAVQNLILAAHALGLGTCVLTAPLLVPDALTGMLDLPGGFELTCLVAMGYPDENPPPPRRKKLEHIYEFLDNDPRAHDNKQPHL
jgi:nitroreductase